MAHELSIDRVSGQVAMFYNVAKGLPLHGLGQKINGCLTWADAMAAAHLDWTVRKERLFRDKGRPIDAWGIFRNDTDSFLGTVGERYEPIQNVKMGNHIDSIIATNKAMYETAGVLRGGERVWAMAKLPETFSIGSDLHRNFILATTAHDGSMSYQLKLITTRVVCNNTLSMALNEKGRAIRVKHTSNALDRINTQLSSADGIAQAVSFMSGTLESLARKVLPVEKKKALFEALFGKDWEDSPRKRTQVAQIANNFVHHDGDRETAGTAYNMLQAITHYADYDRGVRKTDSYMHQSENQIRTEGALWGAGEVLKSQALNQILELCADIPVHDRILSQVVSPNPTVAKPISTGGNLSSILEMVNFN